MKSEQRSGQTQTEDAYRRMKAAIMRGEFPQGAFLSEAEVRKRFGFGRTPFREACNRLHHEQLLEVVPRRGYFVTELNFLGVRDFFEARMLLESMAVELAAQRAHSAQLAEMEDVLRRAQTSAGAPDARERIISLNTEFHLCIVRQTQNTELERLICGVLEKRERLAFIEHRYNRYRVTDFERAHRPILEAIRDHNPVRAREKLIADIAEAQLHIFGQNASGVPVRLAGGELGDSATSQG